MEEGKPSEHTKPTEEEAPKSGEGNHQRSFSLTTLPTHLRAVESSLNRNSLIISAPRKMGLLALHEPKA